MAGMYRFKLSEEAIFRLSHPKHKRVQSLLRIVLRGVNNSTILRHINANRWDGELTKQAALDVMARELGMPAEMLVERQEVPYLVVHEEPTKRGRKATKKRKKQEDD